MMTRVVLLLPIGISLFIAIIQLLTQNWLYFFLWLFVFGALSITLFPVIKKDSDDKFVPILHIFGILGFFVVLSFVASHQEVSKLNLDPATHLLYTMLLTTIIIAIVMITKGN